MLPTFQLQHCPIFLGPLSLAFPAWFEKQRYSRVFILVDKNTQHHCLPYFLAQTGLPKTSTITVIESGEENKNLTSCEKIWQAMLDAQLDRQALMLHLGGGVIGDMGGFCAAIFKRGIDFVQVPTTLLSMTDAAIGGKTGIDFQGIKNAIGVFRQPAAVFVDPVFLQTLPEREYRSGFAEVIKHALIGDSDLAESILTNSLTSSEAISSGEAISSSEAISSLNWLDTLHQSISVKVRIVEEDPFEKDLRRLLNFGHTIGHAVESWFLTTEKPITHGEAVYIGMICEAAIDGRNRLIAQVLQLGKHIFPRHAIPGMAFPALWALMQQDKKNSSGTVRMAVPDESPFSLRILEVNQSDMEQSFVQYNTLTQQRQSHPT